MKIRTATSDDAAAVAAIYALRSSARLAANKCGGLRWLSSSRLHVDWAAAARRLVRLRRGPGADKAVLTGFLSWRAWHLPCPRGQGTTHQAKGDFP